MHVIIYFTFSEAVPPFIWLVIDITALSLCYCYMLDVKWTWLTGLDIHWFAYFFLRSIFKICSLDDVSLIHIKWLIGYTVFSLYASLFVCGPSIHNINLTYLFLFIDCKSDNLQCEFSQNFIVGIWWQGYFHDFAVISCGTIAHWYIGLAINFKEEFLLIIFSLQK